MALMVARFMRFFPGYTDSDVMRMMAKRFFVLNKQISRLQAEEEATGLSVTHNGDPGKRMKELVDRIKGVETAMPSKAFVMQGDATFEEKPGEIAALRERQKAADAEMKQKKKEQWLAEQQAKQNTS